GPARGRPPRRGRGPDGPARADRGAREPHAASGLLAPAQAAHEIPALTLLPDRCGEEREETVGRRIEAALDLVAAGAEDVFALHGGIVDIAGGAGELAQGVDGAAARLVEGVEHLLLRGRHGED